MKQRLFVSLIVIFLFCSNQTIGQSISDFNPKEGNVGSLITIYGSGLANINMVSIAGTPAQIVSSSIIDTELIVMIKPGTVSGKISLQGPGMPVESTSLLTIKSFTAYQLPTNFSSSFFEQTYMNSLDGMQVGSKSVAISADGSYAVMGAPGDGYGNGSVWVYKNTPGGFVKETKLVGSNAIGSAKQGYSISVSADGHTVAIGGIGDNSCQGAVWIFRKVGSNWIEESETYCCY
ncbi:MAG: IPT/TIG domain-containing protein [Cyclobacteriaceae bacterium]